jgi:hypothetical protein
MYIIQYLESVINGTRCTRKIKPGIAMAKEAYIRKKNLPTSKVD